MRYGAWIWKVLLTVVTIAYALPHIAMGESAPPTARGESVQSLFERVANEMPCFPYGYCLIDTFDDRGFAVPPSMIKRYEALIPLVLDPALPLAEVLPLLHHNDPKVRVLAIVAVFAREDPKLLPGIAALRADTALTIPAPEPAGAQVPPPDIETRPPHLRPLTVGEVAEAAIHWYTSQGGVKDYDAFLNDYGNRKFSAAFFAVQMARATQWTTPLRRGRDAHVRAVRARIDQLPEPDRDWMLLAFPDNDALATEAEYVAAAKSLGHDVLLNVLQDIPQYDDPGLLPKTGSSPLERYNAIKGFILRNAKQLLRPEDAPVLLNKQGVAWTLAVAELQPKSAPALLKARIQSSSKQYEDYDRLKMALMLWRIAGLTEKAYLTDWFYTETPARQYFFPPVRAAFVSDLAKNEPANRTMLAILLTDPRADTLGWTELKSIAYVVNTWTKTPVIDPQSLQSAWHPLGEPRYAQFAEEARTKYPKETANLEETVNDWRKRLRESVPIWN